MNSNRLYRLSSQSVIGGVAAGLGAHLGIDRALVRVLFILLFFFAAGFPMVLIYLTLWVALPKQANPDAPITISAG
jgi:phage shock protein C